jgi:hypothetical protein
MRLSSNNSIRTKKAVNNSSKLPTNEVGTQEVVGELILSTTTNANKTLAITKNTNKTCTTKCQAVFPLASMPASLSRYRKCCHIWKTCMRWRHLN